MSNQLIKSEQMPLVEIMTMSKAFFESGMFKDASNAAVAIVKIQAGQEIGVPPFAAMTGIHMIQGKPTLGSNLMAGRIKASGKYDYRVKEHTDKVCSIEFFQGKDSLGVSKFTIEDATRAGTQNLAKYPKNMLFARAISNGVKFFCPDVFSGPVYTPEEFDQDSDGPITEDARAENVTVLPTTPIPLTQEQIKQNNTPAPPPVVTPAVEVKDDLTETHAKWADVIDAIKNKGYSIESIERKYTLSAEVKAALTALVPPKVAAPVTPAATATTGKKPF